MKTIVIVNERPATASELRNLAPFGTRLLAPGALRALNHALAMRVDATDGKLVKLAIEISQARLNWLWWRFLAQATWLAVAVALLVWFAGR